MSRMGRLLLPILGAATTILWFGWFIFDVYLTQHRPEKISVARGYIRPLTEHGGTVYMTLRDWWVLNFLFYGATLTFAAGLLVWLSNHGWRIQGALTVSSDQPYWQGCLNLAVAVFVVAYLISQ